MRGIAVVELALCLTVLFTILLGVSQLGRAMYQYDTLVKSTRAAARYLSQRPPGDAVAISNAKCLAVYGTPCASSGGMSPLVPSLDTSMVTVCDASVGTCGYAALTDASRPTVEVNWVSVTIVGLRFEANLLGSMASYPFSPIAATMPGGSL